MEINLSIISFACKEFHGTIEYGSEFHGHYEYADGKLEFEVLDFYDWNGEEVLVEGRARQELEGEILNELDKKYGHEIHRWWRQEECN